MPLLLILFLILIVWLAITFRARQRVRDCRWRENHEKDSPDGRYFICMTCGAQTFSEDYKPPLNCLRPQDEKD